MSAGACYCILVKEDSWEDCTCNSSLSTLTLLALELIRYVKINVAFLNKRSLYQLCNVLVRDRLATLPYLTSIQSFDLIFLTSKVRYFS